MAENQETTNNSGKTSDPTEESQAKTGTEVREGQEDSSILHDKQDPNKELQGTVHKDVSSTSQEEFIEDRNTKKENDA